MTSKKRDSQGGSEAKDMFKWTDNETELLLRVTLEYKVTKAAEGTNRESVQSKYADILDRMLQNYPETPEDGSELNKNYPHKKEEIKA